jgi:hypothetical protein
VEILLKLLRNEKTSQQVIMIIVKTIAALCLDTAHVNNKDSQLELVEKGAFDVLLRIIETTKSEDIKIETAHSIACLLVGNKDNEAKLDNKLDLKEIIALLKESNKVNVLIYMFTKCQ